jgi:hypothetical protein
MGSSNNACSISSLSLGGGTPVAFFLLHPAKQYRNDDLLVIHPASHLFYSNCFFDPLSLPIFGVYDDYGGVEDIEEDSNTRALEQFFGIPIKDIIDCIVCSRSASDTFSAAYRVDGQYKDLFEYGVSFDAKWLKAMGFEKASHPALPDKELFKHDGFSYWAEVTTYKVEFRDNDGNPISRDEDAFIIWDENGCKAKEGQRCGLKEEFLGAFHELTNYYVHIRPEHQERTNLLAKLSGMFVHRDIYKALVNSPVESYGKDPAVADNRVTEALLEEYGFKHVPEDVQISIDPHHAKLYRKDGFPYDIKWGAFGMAIVHQRHKEYYVFGGIKHLYLDKIRAKWEAMTGTSPDKTFPEPEDAKSVTDCERKAVIERFKELTDATLTWAPQCEDTNHHIFSLIQFAEAWKNFTGEDLDISHHRKKMQHELEFEQLQENLIAFDKREPKTYVLKHGTAEEQLESHKLNEQLRESLATLDGKTFESEPFELKPEGAEYEKLEDTSWHDPFGHWKFASGTGFLMWYKDWKYFADIYRQAIIDGNDDLKQAFTKFQLFSGAMYSCNRFFFPAMNGEQCGNPQESRNLLLASLKIVEQEIAEAEEYE